MPHDRGVVAVVQADDQLGGRVARAGGGQPGDDRLQLTGRDLAGAPAAVRVLGQPDRGGRDGHRPTLAAGRRRSTASRGGAATQGPAQRRPAGARAAGGVPNVGGPAAARLGGQLALSMRSARNHRIACRSRHQATRYRAGGAGEQLRLDLATAVSPVPSR